MRRIKRFLRTLVFQYTLIYVSLFIFSECLIFGYLYWSTVAVYEQRANRAIHDEVGSLQDQFVGLTVTEMAAVVTRRSTDEPGGWDEFLLASRNYEYIAGNLSEWPQGIPHGQALIDLVLGEGSDGTGQVGVHRVRAVELASGEHLLVGRNLTELTKMRGLIGKAFVRTIVLTVVFGFASGFLFSRRVAKRVDKINDTSFAVFEGDTSRRIPTTGKGDEIDVLSRNLNRMLDTIESLMESMREVTEDIAHDLRRPISRLRSRIEVTLMGPRDPDVYAEALQRTIEEADEILAVFNGLLTIAMAESGAVRDRFENIDLAEIARSTVELYQPAAEEAGLDLRLHADAPVRLSGSPQLMTQALTNLLDNAIKYARGSGTVWVRAFRQGAEAQIGVADNGPGMPAEFRKRAVERFARMDESRSTPGSGLGLSLVRAVAVLHGGRVELEDNRPGLDVTLHLPIETPAASRDS